MVLQAYAHWGPDCVSRFNGMWSFALWDVTRRRLFCSRDRFGIKPLVWATLDGVFLFASEPKAILAAHPAARRINPGMLARFLGDNVTVDGEETFYADIRNLPPAHSLILENGRMVVSRYWDYPDADADADAEDAIPRFKELLEDAVRLHSRADVEVASTLSGGLDSSSIVAILRDCFPQRRLRTYSAVFPGQPCDEGPAILAASARHGNLPVTIVQTEQGLERDLRSLVRHLDSPLISASTVPFLRVVRAVAADGVKVLMDGQGADELLAGYEMQLWPPYLLGVLRRLRAGTESPAEALAAIGGLNRRRALWLARRALPSGAHRLYQRLIGAAQVTTADFRPRPSAPPPRERYGDPLDDALWRMHGRTVLPGLLHYGDCISMAASVECRVPFTDYRLVEMMFRLPSSLKFRDGYTKWILRRAMAGRLDDGIRLRKAKNGFDTPLASWLRRSPEVFAPLLDGASLGRHGVFHPAAMAATVKDFLAGRDGLAPYVLRWLSTEMWLQEVVDP